MASGSTSDGWGEVSTKDWIGCSQFTVIWLLTALFSGLVAAATLHVNSLFFLTLALILPSVADLPGWILAY